MSYFVYILICADGSYYTGMTSNLKQRISKHVSGSNKRAYTYSRRPVKLVWSEELPTQEDAKIREKQIKTLSRKRKEILIQKASGQQDI
jgi:predicted GIY-YIG superfamily endonuclease